MTSHGDGKPGRLDARGGSDDVASRQEQAQGPTHASIAAAREPSRFRPRAPAHSNAPSAPHWPQDEAQGHFGRQGSRAAPRPSQRRARRPDGDHGRPAESPDPAPLGSMPQTQRRRGLRLPSDPWGSHDRLEDAASNALEEPKEATGTGAPFRPPSETTTTRRRKPRPQRPEQPSRGDRPARAGPSPRRHPGGSRA